MKDTELVKMGSRNFQRGDQIAYVPKHCQHPLPHQRKMPGYFVSDIGEPGVELGFVTSASPDGMHVWCRFWYPAPKGGVLRTKLNSERCDIEDVVGYRYADDKLIEDVMARWCQ